MWEVIGKATVAIILMKVGWSILKGLYGTFLAAALGLNLDVRKMGKWAVVTGATDGIGKAFAFHLARRGLNVVLISRTPYKLQNVAAEISSKYNVETKIIDVDFTSSDIYERIAKELEGLEIGILINNVGMSYDYPEYFIDIPDGDAMCQRLINCNILSLTMMSRIVLPGMVERRKGLVINVASLSATIPAPFLAIYAATKSYVESLSESLAIEYKNKGITIQCILPGFVVSNMSKIRRPSLMAPTPTAYVSSTLCTTGVEKRTAGYSLHKLEIYLVEIAAQYLPGFVLSSVVYGQLKGMRDRALRKKQEAKTQ